MKMEIKFRIPKGIHEEMMNDLIRAHHYAYERIGFLFTKSKKLNNNLLVIIAYKYLPVADEDYIEDNRVGARINASAIRKSMQQSLDSDCGVFHVHLHNQIGNPSMSFTDEYGIPPIIDGFVNVNPQQSHGLMILSRNSLLVKVRVGGDKEYQLPKLTSIVGYPSQFFYQKGSKITSKVFDRQSFLGHNAQVLFKRIEVGIIGYGGGGSHVGQQLAHVGLNNLVIFDDDVIEDSNMNRLIGGHHSDVSNKLKKTKIARRTIENILATANVKCLNKRWQQNPELLQYCDFVIGTVDSYSERQQLEAECRRYLIPYIDIGMDVHEVDKKFSMSGQIILSMPNKMCMHCMGYLTESKLAIEATKYGNVGGRPQVVWPNGQLASGAVGILIDLLTGWTGLEDRNVYQAYDGNLGTINEHVRLKFVKNKCDHYNLEKVGPPTFKSL